jgi:AcrR family transcriptional regulator
MSPVGEWKREWHDLNLLRKVMGGREVAVIVDKYSRSASVISQSPSRAFRSIILCFGPLALCIHRILTVVYIVYMKAETTTDKIAAAARKLLDKEGSSGVTMRMIASAVGITPMALYRHYPNRDGLLNALADAGFVELAMQLEDLRLRGGIENQILKIFDVFLDYAFANPRLFELMFLTKREGARRYPEDFRSRRSPTANVFADVIAKAVETGYFRKDDVWEIVFETGALMQGLVLLYLGGRVTLSPSEFRSFCHRSFRRYLHGILA